MQTTIYILIYIKLCIRNTTSYRPTPLPTQTPATVDLDSITTERHRERTIFTIVYVHTREYTKYKCIHIFTIEI